MGTTATTASSYCKLSWFPSYLQGIYRLLPSPPLMLAERDREYLKQCRRNRDAEAKLMGNEEGWEVGTWYGHPIYKTTGDKWIDVTFDEFYAHCDKERKNKAANLIHWLKWD